MNILLVEDEAVIRDGIVKLVEQVSGFRIVKQARNGKEALAYMRSSLPDCLVTDIRMQEMDGLTLIARARVLYPQLPVIVISGYGEFEYAQQALRYNVQDYLLKPIDRIELIASLQRVRGKVKKGETAFPEPAHSPAATENEPAGEKKNSSIIRKVKEYIHEHTSGDLRLQVLADHVHLSATYLCQLFKKEAELNLSEYIAEVRIARSKQLLSTTQLKIYEVARLSGFQSPKHFMLIFKQKVGTTAIQYREETVSTDIDESVIIRTKPEDERVSFEASQPL
ncbi:response regulator transcription factor [Cohnella cellulosilytica]|uniref:Response regulator n=1 Tax=Cohnella cellulosilytica TaxID=986710 RepID=A0ABW2F5E7_9BACL